MISDSKYTIHDFLRFFSTTNKIRAKPMIMISQEQNIKILTRSLTWINPPPTNTTWADP